MADPADSRVLSDAALEAEVMPVPRPSCQEEVIFAEPAAATATAPRREEKRRGDETRGSSHWRSSPLSAPVPVALATSCAGQALMTGDAGPDGLVKFHAPSLGLGGGGAVCSWATNGPDAGQMSGMIEGRFRGRRRAHATVGAGSGPLGRRQRRADSARCFSTWRLRDSAAAAGPSGLASGRAA